MCARTRHASLSLTCSRAHASWHVCTVALVLGAQWFAHEAAWAECGGDLAKAMDLYVAHTEKMNNLEPGSISKQ